MLAERSADALGSADMLFQQIEVRQPLASGADAPVASVAAMSRSQV